MAEELGPEWVALFEYAAPNRDISSIFIQCENVALSGQRINPRQCK